MKVVAADGYILCCGLLRALTSLYHDVHVTSANSIDEVLAGISKSADLDLVLLDASMPGMENFEGLRRVVENLRNIPVVVTSASESHTQIIAAIRNGARGYIPPSSKPCVLRHALPLLMAGEFYIPASALRCEKADVFGTSGRPALRTLRAGDGLTGRQREIIIMLAEGKSNKEIARELRILEGTVKLHVRGILRSLGVKNRTEAAIVAMRAGYLPRQTLCSGPPMSECAGGDADQKTPGPSASSPPSQSGTKHTPPPTASRRTVLPNEPVLGHLHGRTRRQRPRSRNADT